MSLSGNNTGIEVPPEVIEALGAGKQPPVVVTVNGYEYRSTVAVMGGRYLISFSSDKRAATGIGGGDPIVGRPRGRHRAAHGRGARRPCGGARRGAGRARARSSALVAEPQEGARDRVEGAKAAETRQRRIDGDRGEARRLSRPAARRRYGGRAVRRRLAVAARRSAPTRRMNALSWATPSAWRGSVSSSPGE